MYQLNAAPVQHIGKILVVYLPNQIHRSKSKKMPRHKGKNRCPEAAGQPQLAEATPDREGREGGRKTTSPKRVYPSPFTLPSFPLEVLNIHHFVFRTPPGACTSAISPLCLPISARAIGERD
jgi:hypothetical protein